MAVLAAHAGVTQPYISQVEAGTVTPSLATLYGLAQALGVAPTALLPSSTAAQQITLTRHDGGTMILQSEAAASPVARMLSGGGGHLDAYEYRVPAGMADDTSFAHPGEELIYVLAGRVSFTLEPDDAVDLFAGDSVHFDATRPHRVIAADTGAIRFLLVAAHPHLAGP